MDKCEGKWVYFKTHIPDVMNKSLIFRQQRSRSNLKKKIKNQAENIMYTFIKIKRNK